MDSIAPLTHMDWSFNSSPIVFTTYATDVNFPEFILFAGMNYYFSALLIDSVGGSEAEAALVSVYRSGTDSNIYKTLRLFTNM